MSETEISEGEEGQFVPFVPASLHKRSLFTTILYLTKQEISVCVGVAKLS